MPLQQIEQKRRRPAVSFYRLLAAAALFSGLSCSLNYNNARSASFAPELVLHGAEFTRVEDGRLFARMKADMLESYRSDNSLFGSNVAFEVYDEDGQVSARGITSLFFADQKNERYALLEGAQLVSVAHDVEVTAENLRWNNKTEQLTAAKGGEVSITRGGFAQKNPDETDQTFTVTGRGFSADGARQDFSFTQAVTGVLTEENAQAQQSGETISEPGALP